MHRIRARRIVAFCSVRNRSVRGDAHLRYAVRDKRRRATRSHLERDYVADANIVRGLRHAPDNHVARRDIRFHGIGNYRKKSVPAERRIIPVNKHAQQRIDSQRQKNGNAQNRAAQFGYARGTLGFACIRLFQKPFSHSSSINRSSCAAIRSQIILPTARLQAIGNYLQTKVKRVYYAATVASVTLKPTSPPMSAGFSDTSIRLTYTVSLPASLTTAPVAPSASVK